MISASSSGKKVMYATVHLMGEIASGMSLPVDDLQRKTDDTVLYTVNDLI